MTFLPKETDKIDQMQGSPHLYHLQIHHQKHHLYLHLNNYLKLKLIFLSCSSPIGNHCNSTIGYNRIAYHYIIKQDGSFEHILQDDQIGWHSGNWNYNCRSIAICFLDDVQENRPTLQAIQTARTIIRRYSNCKIVGHKEVNQKTKCPGSLFSGTGGWKDEVSVKS